LPKPASSSPSPAERERVGERVEKEEMTEVKAELVGSVWKITAKPGDQVAEDDTLLILESMKMEIPVMAPRAGTVKEIRVKEKDVVKEGQVLVVLD
jgi:acetyl-CoA carboxylase biotin carboxyl carrier protein